MYWRHFNLTAEPFSLTPDPSFLYLSPVHAEAFAAMTMGLRERRGLITTIGEVGTGKTTLVYSLLSGLGPEIHTAYISNARLSFDGILRLALRDFGVPCDSANNADLLDSFNKFLLDCATQGTTAALVIDEAQNLSQETFEDLRLLSNFETYTHKLLQIVLVGQPELDAKLREPALRQVAERVAVRCVVNPLTRAQSRQYLEHRLAAVNGSLDLFSAAALRHLIASSRGIPRSLNILAHNSMLFAYGEECHRVERRFVVAAVREKEGNTIVRLWHRPKRTPVLGAISSASQRDLRSVWALGGAAIAGLALGLLLAGSDLGASRKEEKTQPVEPHAKVDTASPAPAAATAEPEVAAPQEPEAAAIVESEGGPTLDAAAELPLAPAPLPQVVLPTVPAAAEPIPDEAAPAVTEAAAEMPSSGEVVNAVPTPPAADPVATRPVALAPTPELPTPAVPAPAPSEPVAAIAPEAPVVPPLAAAAVAPEAPVPPLAAAAPPALPALPAAPIVAIAPPVEAPAAPTIVAQPAQAARAAAAPTARRATATTRSAPAAQPKPRMVTVTTPTTRDRRPATPAATPAVRVAARTPAVKAGPPTPTGSAPAAAETASTQEPATVVTVPVGSSLSDLMLAVYGQYNSQMMERVQAVNPQVTDPDVIIAGDRLRFPDKSNPNPAAAAEER